MDLIYDSIEKEHHEVKETFRNPDEIPEVYLCFAGGDTYNIVGIGKIGFWNIPENNDYDRHILFKDWAWENRYDEDREINEEILDKKFEEDREDLKNHYGFFRYDLQEAEYDRLMDILNNTENFISSNEHWPIELEVSPEVRKNLRQIFAPRDSEAVSKAKDLIDSEEHERAYRTVNRNLVSPSNDGHWTEDELRRLDLEEVENLWNGLKEKGRIEDAWDALLRFNFIKESEERKQGEFNKGPYDIQDEWDTDILDRPREMKEKE